MKRKSAHAHAPLPPSVKIFALYIYMLPLENVYARVNNIRPEYYRLDFVSVLYHSNGIRINIFYLFFFSTTIARIVKYDDSNDKEYS